MMIMAMTRTTFENHVGGGRKKRIPLLAVVVIAEER